MRRRPGPHAHGTKRASVFPSRLALERLRLEPDADRPGGATPSRVLRLLQWREGHWSDNEAASLLQTTPALLHALRPALAASLDAHDAEREAQRAAKAPRTAPAPAREAPARLQRLRAVAAARQGGLVLVMEEIERDNNIAAMLRSCDAFGVGEAILIRSDGAPPLDAETLRAASASADLGCTSRVGDTATALERSRRAGLCRWARVARRPRRAVRGARRDAAAAAPRDLGGQRGPRAECRRPRRARAASDDPDGGDGRVAQRLVLRRRDGRRGRRQPPPPAPKRTRRPPRRRRRRCAGWRRRTRGRGLAVEHKTHSHAACWNSWTRGCASPQALGSARRNANAPA